LLFCVILLSITFFQFLQLVNREMFWVVTEVCSEHNLVRRSKIIKQFIKVASKWKKRKEGSLLLLMSRKLVFVYWTRW